MACTYGPLWAIRVIMIDKKGAGLYDLDYFS